jgi:hypothetical protein
MSDNIIDGTHGVAPAFYSAQVRCTLACRIKPSTDVQSELIGYYWGLLA